MRRVLESDPTCPMCLKNVSPDSIRLSNDPEGDFKTLTSLMKDSGGDDDEEEGEDGKH